MTPARLNSWFSKWASESVGVARYLHDGRAWRGAPAHEQRNPDYAFIADPGGLCRGARFHDVVERDDRGGREISVL